MHDAILELEQPSVDSGLLDSSPNLNPGPEVEGTVEPVKFVSFVLGNDTFVIPAALVAEVVNPLPVTPLPNSPTILAGISALRGEILAVLDLSGINTDQPVSEMSRPKLIVLASEGDSLRVAIPVDRVSELQSLDPDGFSLEPEPHEFVLAHTSRDCRIYRYLDTTEMIRNLSTSLN